MAGSRGGCHRRGSYCWSWPRTAPSGNSAVWTFRFVDPTNPGNDRVVPFLGRENKDTIRLPAAPGAHEGAGGKAILRLAVRFDDAGRNGQVEAFGKTPTRDRSGGWMIHCHNQEHSEAGMMPFLELRAPRSARSASRS